MEAALRLHDWWVNRHPLLRVVMVVVLLGAVGFFLAPVGLSAFRDWKSGRTAGEAKLALERGDMVAARDLALQVIRADREGSEEVFPVLMKSADALGDPIAANAASMIWRPDTAAGEEARLEAWGVLVRHLPSAPLIGMWAAAEEAQRFRPDVLGPFLDRALEEGNLVLVREVLSLLPRPLDDEIEARRLRALSLSADPLDRSDLARELTTATYERPEATERWLELLPSVPDDELCGRVGDTLRGFLENFPEEHVEAGLQRGRLDMLREPEKADLHFVETYERYGKLDPWATARWCRERGRERWARELVPLDEPEDEPERLEFQVQLLVADGRSADAVTLLESAAETRSGTWLAGLWRTWAEALGGDEKARSEMAAATLKSATESSDPLAPLELARTAERIGRLELARDAWASAYARRIGPLPLAAAMRGLLPALEAGGDEQVLLAVLDSLQSLEPGNAVIQRHYAYLRLTNGLAEPDRVIEELEPFHERNPESLSLRIVLALGHLLAGRADQAEDLTEVEDLDWFDVPANARALRVAILRAVGRSEEAEIYAEGLELEAFLPSEQRLYEALLED